uniref:Uncharacterized protein n=1 Tax=Anguilla anguilla TaxID=7936 RepID=A0A0E9PJC2_ANGAN
MSTPCQSPRRPCRRGTHVGKGKRQATTLAVLCKSPCSFSSSCAIIWGTPNITTLVY